MTPFCKRIAIGLASLLFAALAWAADPRQQPLDPAQLDRIRTLGLVDAAEPAECDIHVYTRHFGGSSFSADLEQLLRIREFSALTGVAKAELQAKFSEALVSALGREQGALPALQVKRLARPEGVRGVHRLAERALPGAGTDAVLASFLRVGYVAFKPGDAYKPFVTVRAVLYDTGSGQLLYDEMVTAGQNPSSTDSAQVPAPWPAGGATSLEALRTDPAQAAAAWSSVLEALATRVARDFRPAPVITAEAAPAPTGSPPPDAPVLTIGAKPLKLRLADAAPLLVKLPAARQPYVLRVAGEVELSAKLWSIVTPELVVLDDKMSPMRRLDGARAVVRGGRIEQALYAGPGDAWLWIGPAARPPAAQWSYINATSQKIYAGVITYDNRSFVDLTGTLPASTTGPVEVRADAPVTAAP